MRGPSASRKTAGIFHVTAHAVRDSALFRDDLRSDS